MRKWLAALVPWMVTTAALAQAPSAVQVEYTFLGKFKEESVRIENECWVTPALLKSWGLSVTDKGDLVDVSHAGRAFSLPARRIDTKTMVSLHEAARFLGAELEWSEDKSTIKVFSQLRIIEAVEGGMRIDFTLPVQVTFSRLPSPDRLIMDFNGAKVQEASTQGLPSGWRAGQFSPSVARVVVESPEMAKQFLPTFKAARSFLVKFSEERFDQVDPDEASQGGIAPPDQQPPDVQVTVVPKPQATVSTPNLAREDDKSATFMLPYTGSLASSPSAKYIDSKTIQITIPVSEPSNNGATTAYESKFMLHSESKRNEAGHTVVTFSLIDTCAFELKNNDRIITLRVFKPKEASGKLANKVIVVDAGHGGRETGTTWGKTYEKDLTLSIAKKLAAYLTEAGASVVMIRNEDTTVPLLSRPETANESKADLYISVHINSNQTANSVSGGMTFYHMQDPVSMMLAQCIQTEIASVSKIPDMGVWSDSRIYKTKGFAVLRGAAMPAVLIELGFLNNSKDRARLVQPEFHDAAAKAIVKGIKSFLGDGDGK